MNRLIEESPEAKDMFETVKRDVDSYKVYAGERFKDIFAAVLATTGIDGQGDIMGEEQLRQIARKVNEGTVWLSGREHNPFAPPQGRFFKAEVFEADGKYFVCAVGGVYSVDTFTSFTNAGIDAGDAVSVPEPSTEDWEASQSQEYEIVVSGENATKTFDDQKLAQTTPPEWKVHVKERVQKGFVDYDVLEVAIFVTCLGAFLKGFFSELGRQTADDVKRLLSSLLQGMPGEDDDSQPVFRLRLSGDGCDIILIANREDPQNQDTDEIAIEQIDQGLRVAANLIEQLDLMEVKEVALVFDPEEHRWEPHYAVTVETGIITDERDELNLDDFNGVSITGTVECREVERE